MSDSSTVREAESSDIDRIRELVETSMTASYALSPQDIETILESEFSEDALGDRLDGADTVVFVAVGEEVIVGVVEVTLSEGEGEIRWLHVDPERHGRGVGTALFERAIAEVEDRKAGEKRAVALAANTSAGTFFEKFGFEKIDERAIDTGGRETVEYVYREADRDEPEVPRNHSDATASKEEFEYPEAVATNEGENVYLGDDPFPGTEGAFVSAYTDAESSNRYGYYCLNCMSSDVSMDSMERIRCGNCGNTRKPDDDYDGSYL